jgi:hypothetical protein
MVDAPFLFVGYLVQEPYLTDPRLLGARIATLDRRIVPDLDRFSYESHNGFANITKFLTHLPDIREYPGWVLNGYAVSRDAVKEEIGIDGSTILPSRYEYAKHWRRAGDHLSVLGYDVVDESANPFSLLHAKPDSYEEIQKTVGELNEYGLFANSEHAKEFCRVIAPNEEAAAVWQVWG